MTETIREWTLYEELGHGAMGIIYRATHAIMPGEFAVKRIKPELISNDEVRARFLREVVIVKNLVHPNIIKTELPFEEDDCVYLPMERLVGRTLSDELKQQPGPWPAQKAIAVIRAAAAAMGYAHTLETPVFHRDLKPGNLFICEDHTVKVMDFGLAKAIGQKKLTDPKTVAGTPAYLAPEILKGQEASASSDVYALGVILYRLLAGRVPIKMPEGESSSSMKTQRSLGKMRAVIEAHEKGIEDIRIYAPETPESLSRLVMKTLESDPSKRFSDGQELHLALKTVDLGQQNAPNPDDDDTELGLSLDDLEKPIEANEKGARTFPPSPSVSVPKHFPSEPCPSATDSLSYYDDLIGEARKTEQTVLAERDKKEQRILAEKRQKEQVVEQVRQAWKKVQTVYENEFASLELKGAALQRFIDDFGHEENPYYQEAAKKLESISLASLKIEKKTVTLKVPKLYKKHGVVRPAGLFRKAQYGNVEHSRIIKMKVSIYHHKIVTSTGDVKLDIGLFSVLPPGQFEMGNSSESNESPVHQVKIDYSFEMMQTPVTQGLWKTVMGNNPSEWPQRKTDPVNNISWYESVAFCNALSLKAGLVPYYILSNEKGYPGEGIYKVSVIHNPNGRYGYRLPSEADWEYACRAGTKGDRYGALDDIAVYGKYRGNKIGPVGKKHPNAFGLYDMLGNVWEWVEDQYHETYQGAPSNGSAWVNRMDSHHVLRGGSWFLDGSEGRWVQRASGRIHGNTYIGLNYTGFRCSRNVK